jgi:hypothetical protein
MTEHIHEHDISNKGKRWKEWELREILRDPPTKQNVERWRRVYKRGAGGVGLVYKWAYSARWKIDKLNEEGDGRYYFANRVWNIGRELGIII